MFPNVLAPCTEATLISELEAMADADLRYLQARPETFADADLVPTAAGRQALLELEGLGIEIVGWCGYRPLIGADDAVSKNVEHIRKCIRFAHAARELSDNVRPVVFSESGSPAQNPDLTYEQMWAQIVSAVGEIAEEAEKQDALFGFEPTRSNILDCSATTVRLLKEVGSGRVKSLFDPANTCGDKDTIEGAVETLAPYLILAHAKDVILKGPGEPPEYPPAGKGEIDYPRVFQLLEPIATCNEIIIEYVRSPEQARETVAFLRQFCD